ncbi:hypothetical protein EV122DRAFT_277355 [Schizophyllum commune]
MFPAGPVVDVGFPVKYGNQGMNMTVMAYRVVCGGASPSSLRDPFHRRGAVALKMFAQCHLVDHGVDVQYMLRNLTNAVLETSVLLSEQVMYYWLSFVTI